MDEEIWNAFFRNIIRCAGGELPDDDCLLLAWIAGQFLPEQEEAEGTEEELEASYKNWKAAGCPTADNPLLRSPTEKNLTEEEEKPTTPPKASETLPSGKRQAVKIWTDAEDKEVEKWGEALPHGRLAISVKLNRTSKACEQRYYYLKKKRELARAGA